MTKPEQELLREFRKLSKEGRREVLEYVRWLRDVEAKERLRGYEGNREVFSQGHRIQELSL